MADVSHANSVRPVEPPLPQGIRLVATARHLALYCGLWLIVAPGALSIGNLGSDQLKVLLWVSGIALFGLSYFLGARSSIVSGAPLVVAAPVRGRWVAINSPASGVPSHGTHLFGQAYAIDLIFETDLIGSGAKGAFLPPADFQSYAKPIFAVAEGNVVRLHNGRRDHKSRSTKSALFYFAIEGFVRSFGPPSFILGNYLVLRLQDGSHMVYAHLRQGSLRVSLGHHVATGDLIAECGNSGNTTMPHLHIQRQDVASVLSATGLPWGIAGAGEGKGQGFPKNGQIAHFGPLAEFSNDKEPSA